MAQVDAQRCDKLVGQGRQGDFYEKIINLAGMNII